MDYYRTPEKDLVDKDISNHPSNRAQAYDAEKLDADDPEIIEGRLVEAERYGQTKRGLKSRHIQLIALGGAIGMIALGGEVEERRNESVEKRELMALCRHRLVCRFRYE